MVKICIREKEPYRGECAFGRSIAPEDFCKAMSSSSLRGKCRGCGSPYRLEPRFEHATKQDIPALDVMVSESSLAESWKPRNARVVSDDNDEEDAELEFRAADHDLTAFLAAVSRGNAGGDQACPKKKWGGMMRQSVDPEDVFRAADAYRENRMPIATLARRMKIKRRHAVIAVKLANLSPEVRRLVELGLVSIWLASFIVLYPKDLQPYVAGWVMRKDIPSHVAQNFFLDHKVGSFRKRAERLGLAWPPELDDNGVRKSG